MRELARRVRDMERPEEAVWAMPAHVAGAGPVLRVAVLRVSPLDLPAPHRERYARLVCDVCDTGGPP